jgi:hypothetical protein
VTSGQGGPPFYTLATLKVQCPNAVVLSIGINVGNYNPDYNINVDGIAFNGTTFNFEWTNVPANKDQCKSGGYQSLTDANGQPFRNQRQCISYFNTGG